MLFIRLFGPLERPLSLGSPKSMSLDDDFYQAQSEDSNDQANCGEYLHNCLTEAVLKNDLEEFFRISNEPRFDWNHVRDLPDLIEIVIKNQRFDMLRFLLSHPKLKELQSVPTELCYPIVQLEVPEWILYLSHSGLDFWQADKELLACCILDIPSLTIELYKWALPKTLGSCEAIQRKLVENEFLPLEFLEYAIIETDLELGPVQIMVPDLKALEEDGDADQLISLGRMSYVSYASLFGNHVFRDLLMASPRYIPYIAAMNAKIDVAVRQKLASHYKEYQKISGQAVQNFV